MNDTKKKICTIRILDEVNCVVVNLHPDHILYFYEEYGVFAPNYFFNPKFKLGSWDGKIRHFQKTGKTYVNLLPDLVPRIIGLGYNIKLDDTRKTIPIHPEPITASFFGDRGVWDEDRDCPWEIRDYQIGLVNALLANGGGIGIAGTGGGKTGMTAAIALSYELAGNLRSIIIVPDKNLTDQTVREYKKFGLDVGEYSGTNKDLNHQHIVSTWQALQNNPTVIHSFQVAIVDECHGLRGNVISKLMNEHGKYIPYRFGVTGTLPKDPSDAIAVKIAVGEVQYEIPAHELIDRGVLAQLQIDIMQLEVNLKDQYDKYLESGEFEKPMTYIQFKESYFPDFPAEKAFLQQEESRLNWIADYIEIRRNIGKGNTLVLVGSVKFGKKLAKKIKNAMFLYGQDPMETRKEIYAKFKEHNNLVVIATAQIASTGLDIKRIFNLMYIDVGKSFIRTIQSIGRGLRKATDKDSVHVTDICSDLKYSKKHLRERIKFYVEAKYKHKKHLIEYVY